MKLKEKITIIISVLIIVIITLLSIEYKNELYDFYTKIFSNDKKEIKLKYNKYFKNKNYLYVKNTNDFYVKDEEHLKDIIYTILNSGTNSFTFYCDKTYSNCINDVKKLSNDKVKLSNINNFVHPYNSFKKIIFTTSENGIITIDIIKNYTDEEIEKLNEKVNKIIKDNIIDTMTDKTKIRIIHDYIINNSNYTTDEKTNNENNKATGNLLNGNGLCSGYADSMALFLEKMNIDNYKIASDTHIWNLVFVDDQWLHLDLTWDDPVASDGKDRLEILFFLINDKRLNEIKVDQHDYDKLVYLETKMTKK